MQNVKLCSNCKFRPGISDGPPCGAHPEAKRLKDARDQCGGKDWLVRYPRWQPSTRPTKGNF